VCHWVPGMSLPAAHVEQAWQSAEFYSNKIMMEFRNSEPAHVDWVKSLKAVMTALIAFVKKYHVAGPAWNPAGPHVSQFKPGAGTNPQNPDIFPFVAVSGFPSCLGSSKLPGPWTARRRSLLFGSHPLFQAGHRPILWHGPYSRLASAVYEAVALNYPSATHLVAGPLCVSGYPAQKASPFHQS
jgi:hypothetical protein